MNTILDPVILVLPEIDWYDETNRDDFLDHLHDNLENIDTYSLTKIYWNDYFESYLWDSPPWRRDTDWKNKLVPWIFNTLHKNKINFDCSKDMSSCNVSPFMKKCHINEINICFLKLMHEIIKKEEKIFLCLSTKNKLSNNDKYSFSCICHSKQLVPELIKKPDDWLNHIDLEDGYWPNNIYEAEKFKKAIEIVRKRDFNNKIFLYKYKFSEGFIRDIIGINRNKKNIIKSIVNRLVLTSLDAGRELRDKYLVKKREYRFNVTHETRIHYLFSDENEIEFLHYYGEGEHDDGLRKR